MLDDILTMVSENLDFWELRPDVTKDKWLLLGDSRTLCISGSRVCTTLFRSRKQDRQKQRN